MRDIKILNKNYEVANLYTVVYEGYTIKEIIEDSPSFDVTPPQHYLDYWQKIYDYFKSGTKVPGYSYLPQGQSKYDVAYVNKTIDDPIAELNGHTLREVFEDNNIYVETIGDLDVIGAAIDEGDEIRYNSVNAIGAAKYMNADVNDYIYVYANYRNDNVNAISITYREGTIVRYNITLPIPQTEYSYTSKIIQSEFILNKIEVTRGSNVDANTWTNYFGVINLSDLDISPTTDIDYYYSLYKSRKNITKKVLTYAEIFEESNMIYPFSTTYWYSGSGVTLNFEDNVLTIPANPAANETLAILRNDYKDKFVAKAGDKLYFNVEIKAKNKTVNDLVQLYSLSTPFTYFISYYATSIPENEWYRNSRESIVPYALTGDFRIDNNNKMTNQEISIKNLFVVNYKNFDESITKELLDTMLTHYLQVKNIVIYPEIYVPTDPTGFGNRYAFHELNKKVYGHELDFENMQLNLLFGVYRNAYDSYHQLMNFIINNEGIIAYDYGKGVRYSDIRLIKSPKTELDDGQYLKEKFDFKRLSPFYTLEQGTSLTIKNIHDWDLKPIVAGTVNTNIVYIEAEDTLTGLTKTVKFDFTAVTKPFNFYYNSETKQILINGINNGYQYIDFTQGISFISLPKDTEHIIWTTGITSPVITVKKWVID